MSTSARLTAAFAVVLAAGCRTASVETVAYAPDAQNDGLVYSLPLTRLKVTVTYTVVWKKSADGREKPEAVYVDKPVRVEALAEPDRRNTYVLSGAGLLNDVRLDSTFKFSLTPSQLLSGVTAEAADKTEEIVKGLVGAAMAVVKSAAGPGAAVLPRRGGRMQEEPGEREERDVAHTVSFGLRDMAWTGSGWRKEIQAPSSRLGVERAATKVPTVVIEVDAGAAERANAERTWKPVPGKKAGVLYRNPVRLVTRVSVPEDGVALFEEPVGFSEAGSINSLEARSRSFSKRKTTIAFDAATGAVREYGVEASSPAEAAAKSLDASLAKIEATLAEIRKAQEAAAAGAAAK